MNYYFMVQHGQIEKELVNLAKKSNSTEKKSEKKNKEKFRFVKKV